MANNKFSPGDLVILKSGGPDMVVDLDWGDGTYRCTWFAGEKHQQANFRGATLKLADEE